MMDYANIEAARARLTTTDQWVLAVAALLPIAWLPVFLEQSAARVALALVLLPLGIAGLLVRSLRGAVADRLALAVIAVAVISALASPAPGNALIGSLENWTGALGLATALAWWSCGRALTGSARAILVPALTVGALWNVTLALIQIVADIDSAAMYPFPGRGTGSMQNPVYLGAFLSAVTCCWIARDTTTRWERFVVFSLGFGVGLSAGRAAIGATLLVAVWVIARSPDRRRAIVRAVCAAIGAALATLLISVRYGDSNVAQRAAEGDGTGIRLAVWRASLEALSDRPWLGWGPANVELATERHFGLDYTRRFLTDDDTLVRWIDVHNVVIGTLLTLGILGFALAASFVIASLRAGRDLAFLAGASAIAVNWLAQPVTIHTLPIAFLLLGAAIVSRESAGQSAGLTSELVGEVRVRRMTASALALGCATAVALLASVFVVDFGIRTGRLDLASSAADVGYSDSFVDETLTMAYSVGAGDGEVSDEDLHRAVDIAERLVRRHPTANSYQRLGEYRYLLGDLDGAYEQEREVLEFQPWNPISHRRLLALSNLRGDERMGVEAEDALCRIGAKSCESLAPGRVSDDP